MKSKFFIWLLAVLGFGFTEIGCKKDAYGSPYANYEVKGNVVDKSGNPIEGIKVSVRSSLEEGYRYGSAQTNASGGYNIVEGRDGRLYSVIYVTAEDIDGEANGGEFAAKTETVEIQSSDYVGGDRNWYIGKVTKTVNFVLEEAIPDNTGEDEE